MSVTAGVSDAVIDVRDKKRGKIGQTKVKRYWPGKAPDWGDDNDEDGDIKMGGRSVALEKAFPSHEESVIGRKDDPRLRRLAESRIDKREDHRRIRCQGEIVLVEEEDRQEGMDVEDEDEDALEFRRQRIREKLLQKQKEEEGLLRMEGDDEIKSESDDESCSEYETESEDEILGIAMVKPVFVPKVGRDTIAERERMEAEERALEELVKRRCEERRVETKQIVVEKIREAKEIVKNMEKEGGIAEVDSDDELNEAEEYEAWKVREVARIKREREDREITVKEKEEIERLRNMTEEERREWDRKNPKPAPPPKRKRRFLQKYFHKGAFFQADADDRAGTASGSSDGVFVYTHDFSAPTGEDKMNKTKLPKIMQVKHFGRSGRTKWTHLVNEDTTDWTNPWTFNGQLTSRYKGRMAAPIARPKGSKKLKDWESRGTEERKTMIVHVNT